MKILDKYILKSFILTFSTVFVILFLIFILQTVWLFIGELAGKDLDLILILKFLMYKMPSIVPLVLPLSIVLASIMTFGSFAENYEFAAMKSAGISLQRAMRALSVFILLLAFASFAFANNVIPFAEYKFINFRRNLAQVKPALAIAEGQFSDIGTYNIKVDKKSGEKGSVLSGITIHKKSGMTDGNNTVIKAKNGRLVSNEKSNILKLELNNGYYYEDIVPKKFEQRRNLPFAKSAFRKYVINIDLSKLNKTNLEDEQITNTNTMLNVSELNYTLDSLNSSYGKEMKSFAEDIYQRTGISALTRPTSFVPPAGTNPTPTDLLARLSDTDRSNVLKVAITNVSNTGFAIESSKFEMDDRQKNINNHWIALHEKFVFAFSCFLMFFIGAPLGAIIRKGGLGLPIVFAVTIFIIFHFVNTFGKKVAQENGISPFLGTWLSSIILAPLAVMLTYRATNDMNISINFDWLTGIFKKFSLQRSSKEIRAEDLVIDLQSVSVPDDGSWRTMEAYQNEQLLEIVRDGRQHNHLNPQRVTALKILEMRGISQQHLLENGNLYDSKFLKLENAEERYAIYSKTALVAFFITIVLVALMKTGKMAVYIIGLVNAVVFYSSVYKSYESLKDLRELTGKKIGLPLVVALILGYPLYVIIYFYNKSAIKKAIAQYT